MVTKYDYVNLYNIETGDCICKNRISSDPIFISTEYTETAGIIFVNMKGQLLSVSINESNIIPYIKYTLEKPDLALRTPQTFQKFQCCAEQGGKPTLLLEYFDVLLKHGKLNSYETLEFCRYVLTQGKKELLEDQLREGKLEWSSESNDLAERYGVTVPTHLQEECFL
ncbi:unnamed protein product [Enterobius vermicularis]|uniref:Uncharacterized protein n=1 Tax=Enterobius vermicularis TaxID=51028 RepID=A0A3P6I3A2_ENTVE|nr:unnamed protein product [Enterobius vermicularis]